MKALLVLFLAAYASALSASQDEWADICSLDKAGNDVYCVLVRQEGVDKTLEFYIDEDQYDDLPDEV